MYGSCIETYLWFSSHKKGVDIKVVSEILGHKDVSVTYNIYIHIIDEQKVSAMAKLNEIFSSSDNNMAQSINKTN